VPARRLPSWVWVTALTAAALVGVAALTAQADQGVRPTASAGKPKPSASAGASPSASPKKAEPAAVPDASGTGRRIVYSLAQRRVWLVDATEAVRSSFTVWPGTVNPTPGPYAVSYRRATGTGTDGVNIEHIVYFTVNSGISIAFSNAQDGSSPKPSAGVRTGAIRVRSTDGAALWTFGGAGTKVVVVK